MHSLSSSQNAGREIRVRYQMLQNCGLLHRNSCSFTVSLGRRHKAFPDSNSEGFLYWFTLPMSFWTGFSYCFSDYFTFSFIYSLFPVLFWRTIIIYPFWKHWSRNSSTIILIRLLTDHRWTTIYFWCLLHSNCIKVVIKLKAERLKSSHEIALFNWILSPFGLTSSTGRSPFSMKQHTR